MSRRRHSRAAEGPGTYRRIHVVGSSPRTGTTLLAELMAVGFEVESFGRHERSVFDAPPGRCEVHLSKNPQDVLVAHRILPRDPQLFFLHLVRDPRDVVVSRHRRDPEAYWTNLGLWHRWRRAARRAADAPRFHTFRYEDLVADPDAVQEEIAGLLPFLKRRLPFSSFAAVAAPPPRSVEALGGVRAVEPSAVGAWRDHKPRLAAQIARHGPPDRDLIDLGYETDDAWKRELEGVVPDNGRSHLSDSPALSSRAGAWFRRERRIAAYGRQPQRRARRDRVPRARPGPFRVERLRAGDVRLEVGTLGEGPAVLLIPGLGLAGTEEFDALGRALAAAGFRAIALNPRGVGRSRGRLQGLTLHDWSGDAARVLEQLCGDDRVHVVGRGFGNRVARCLAADAPQRVASLCLVAAGGFAPPLRQTRASPRERARRRWQRVRRAQKAASDATRLEAWWDGGTAPMLVIQGTGDAIAPPENGRKLARDHPQRVRLLEIEGAGHDLLHARADRVVPAIVSYLEERAQERGAPEGE